MKSDRNETNICEIIQLQIEIPFLTQKEFKKVSSTWNQNLAHEPLN